ncbi:class I SAM-dependent methyltransferase [Roseisalinus antarcticus]|nr:class I SAM-dependent methyltransferase [Roseisalinus antarcticus]
MADDVRRQYEVFPYPERDPADEADRLIAGSPSDPVEIDHYLFGGGRDWSGGFRALVAGGGTGDGLIQLAQKLAWAGVDAEVTYLDLSRSARRIAKARAEARGLTNIRFLTGSLLRAGDHGRFDYIDCCGVLHHLPEPAEGFAALRGALAPGGGLGFMVYAPYGRSGVYQLQQAFGDLFGHLPETERLSEARKVLAHLPAGHPFKRNPNLVDHKQGDAGFYDLLLHSQDRAFTIAEVVDTLTEADLRLVAPIPSALYDPARFVGPAPRLNPVDAMSTAERLDGMMKVHVGYAVAADDTRSPARGTPQSVPHLMGPPERIAAEIAGKGALAFTAQGRPTRVRIPREAAPFIARIDGKRTLSEIAGAEIMAAEMSFARVWPAVEEALTGWNILRYSGLPPV